MSIQEVVEEFTALALAGLGASELRIVRPMPRRRGVKADH
jgi:hypothetical protein